MSYEQAVIGTALTDQSSMDEAQDLVPSDFTEPGHQLIWAEMITLYRRQSLEVRSLAEALRVSPDLPVLVSELGPIEDYIDQLLAQRGTMMTEYSSHVLDASIKRGARKSAAMIAALALDERSSASEVLEFAEKHILSLRRNRMVNGISMADLFGVYIPRLDGLRDGTVKPAWIPELVALREVIQFAEATDLITIAARPGDGKSSFMRYEMLKYAINGGRPLIFNLENDEMDYAMHFLALFVNMDGLSIIENTKLKNPRLLSNDELRRVKDAARLLSRLPITIVTMGSPSVSQITQVARRKIVELNCDLIGIDYVQLIRNGDKENRNDDIGQTTGALRGFGLNMHVPILENAQLNRNIERRGKDDSDPQLADLRDSGSIEQDSTHVVFPRGLWKDPSIEQMRLFPENMDENNRPFKRLKTVPLVFYVRKNRNGPTGPSAVVAWKKTTGDFQTMTGDLRV